MIIRYLLRVVVVQLMYGREFLYSRRKVILWIFHPMVFWVLWSLAKIRRNRLCMGRVMGKWGLLIWRRKRLRKCQRISLLFGIYCNWIAITSWLLLRIGSWNYGRCQHRNKWKVKNNLLHKDYLYLVILAVYTQYVNLDQVSWQLAQMVQLSYGT